MISSLNYASPNFAAQQAVKPVPAKDQKAVSKPVEKAPAKKPAKKQKTGKGAMITMGLATAGSLFFAFKNGSKLKVALKTIEEQAGKIADSEALVQKLQGTIDKLQSRGFFKRIFTSNKKV